jgi:acyl-CoA thioesterase-2
MAASLDHAVWFHRPTRADQWLAFSSTGHGMSNARGLAVTRVHTTNGIHVATVVQEGLGRARGDATHG